VNFCGLEALIENNEIVKVRPDKENPRSQGYACRKGLNIKHHQHHADRLMYPLKKVGDAFQRISWDQALGEIAVELSAIVDRHGPRATTNCPHRLFSLPWRELSTIYSNIAK